jgi:hypothetical protein
MCQFIDKVYNSNLALPLTRGLLNLGDLDEGTDASFSWPSVLRNYNHSQKANRHWPDGWAFLVMDDQAR